MPNQTEQAFYVDTGELSGSADVKFANALDSSSEAATIHAIDQLSATFANTTSSQSEKYSALSRYRKERQTIHSEQLNGGTDTIGNNLRSFEALRSIAEATDSHYTRRLADWAINEELHGLSDAFLGMPLVDIDQTKSDPEALRRYFSGEQEGEWTRGLVYSPSEYGTMLLEAYPEAADALAYMAEQSVKYPGLGESDGTYAPDPYMKLSAHLPEEYYQAERAPGEAELTLETSSLFGVQYEALNPTARAQLFEYGVSLTEAQVSRIDACVGRMSEAERLQFAEAFLATEFGDDYGEVLLSIAENANPEESANVFGLVNNFRNRSREYARWFHDYDAGLANAVEKAMNERLTDALYAVEYLAREGKLEVDVAPHRHIDDYESDGRFMIHLESLESGIEILHSLEKSMKLMHDVVTSEDVVVSRAVQNTEQFMMYRFSSEKHGETLLYIRPEAAKGYDKTMEYGNRGGVEASISFITNPTDPHRLRSDKDPSGVSIRFDREGRMVDESPFSDDRDPTRTNGSISLDISSGLGDGRTMPVKIGRFIAAGNILRAAKTGSKESLHHNTNHFNQSRYGSREGFAKLAVYTAHMAEAMIALQADGRHGSRYNQMPGILQQEDVKLAA